MSADVRFTKSECVSRYNRSGPRGAGNTGPGLTHSLDYSKEGLMPNPTRTLTTCSVNGCENPDNQRIVRGMCLRHYSAERYQRIKPAPKPRVKREQETTPAPIRFERMVDRSETHGGCWIWTGAKTSLGYGRFHPDKNTMCQSSRWALSVHIGRDLESWEFACHSCDNPSCVNPAHLFIGTHEDNMADMVAKGRWWSSKRRTKLTAEQVVQMREEAASGIPQIELARSYSMSIGAVSQIVRGLNWRHVGGPISNHSNNSKESK